MAEEYTAREIGIFRQQQARNRSLEVSIARQEEIDATSPPLRYVSYDADRGARASTDGGTVYVPIITNGAIALGSSVISTGGVLDGAPRVVRETPRSRERPSLKITVLFQTASAVYDQNTGQPTIGETTQFWLKTGSRATYLLNSAPKNSMDRSRDKTAVFCSGNRG